MSESSTVVFIVDDETDILECVGRFLSSKDRSLKAFSSPTEALSAIVSKETRPDLIVTDILMPEMDGFEFIAKIHEICPNIPIVIVTGYAYKDISMSAQDLGVVAIIEKPFEPALLQEVIDRALLSSPPDRKR